MPEPTRTAGQASPCPTPFRRTRPKPYDRKSGAHRVEIERLLSAAGVGPAAGRAYMRNLDRQMAAGKRDWDRTSRQFAMEGGCHVATFHRALPRLLEHRLLVQIVAPSHAERLCGVYMIPDELLSLDIVRPRFQRKTRASKASESRPQNAKCASPADSVPSGYKNPQPDPTADSSQEKPVESSSSPTKQKQVVPRREAPAREAGVASALAKDDLREVLRPLEELAVVSGETVTHEVVRCAVLGSGLDLEVVINTIRTACTVLAHRMAHTQRRRPTSAIAQALSVLRSQPMREDFQSEYPRAVRALEKAAKVREQLEQAQPSLMQAKAQVAAMLQASNSPILRLPAVMDLLVAWRAAQSNHAELGQDHPALLDAATAEIEARGRLTHALEGRLLVASLEALRTGLTVRLTAAKLAPGSPIWHRAWEHHWSSAVLAAAGIQHPA